MEHSAVLLTCIKLPHGFKTLFCLFLSVCLRQVSLYKINIEVAGKCLCREIHVSYDPYIIHCFAVPLTNFPENKETHISEVFVP